MGKKTRASIYTMLISVMNSVLIVVFNLVYNNLLIQTYGSEINGLISTLTQFVSLFAIIEGGFTTAAVVATYTPIVNRDYTALNNILFTTKRTYMRIGLAITGGVLVCGSIYINFIDSPLSYSRTYAVLVISVLTTASSLCFLSKYSVLLLGSNKEYVQVVLSLVAKTITWIVSMILILQNANILLVYSINVANILLNLLLVRIYEKKHFPEVTYKGTFDKKYIEGTNDVLFQKIANTIFTSTDLVLISVFVNMASASVYNLYYQVFKSIFTLLASVVQAPFNSFGQLVGTEEGREKLEEYFQIYQHLVLIISAMFLTITGALIVPFVRVYTIRINDYNYIYPSLAILFFSQIFAQIINRPYGTILNVTGNFKMQNKQCFAAAIVNIVVSLLFIKVWGINSIIFGSFVGTLVIVVMNIIQVHKHIIKFSAKKSVKNIIFNYLSGVVVIAISLWIDNKPDNYIIWILYAIIYSLIISLVFVIENLIIDKNNTIKVYNFIKSSVLTKLRR